MSVKLTEFTSAGGCGCKLPPNILGKILNYNKGTHFDEKVIVGNSNFDDAAVYQISKTKAIVSTVDFFTPIVNDPFTFGQIAAANSISDVFAMGGKPLWALAILGFPNENIEPEVGKQILEGANYVCEKGKISIIGGHSINNPQPIFGLSVNGIINIKNIKQNKNAQIGDYIFLTKPLGVGILSTAHKLNKIEIEHYDEAVKHMTSLNSIGKKIAKLNYVNIITDITGFGLLGHLLEVCNSSNVGALINFKKIKLIKGVEGYVQQNIITSGGKRNWDSYSEYILGGDKFSNTILSDPQTNGGLLITVQNKYVNHFREILVSNNLQEYTEPIGQITEKETNTVKIIHNEEAIY